MLNSLGLPFHPTRLISGKRNDEKDKMQQAGLKTNRTAFE